MMSTSGWITYPLSLAAAISLATPLAYATLSALPAKPKTPAGNPTTPAKVSLGRQLFFDPRLSASGTISCNSCHNVMAGGEDGRAVSVGVDGKLGGRSAPTVWNAAFASVQFWDGRAATLEDQAKGPMTNPVEMGMANHDLVVGRIREMPGYVRQFQAVFGKSAGEPVTIDRAAQAIAAFERTLITPNSPYDRYVQGDKKALTASAKRGLEAVQRVGCMSCHSGPLFSGPELPEGQGYFQKFPLIHDAELEARYGFAKDPGRFEVTRKAEDRNLWRVPTWRNVALTAPYFHNGSVKRLDEAVRIMAKTQLGRKLEQAEVDDIVAFLNSLTGEFPEQKLPRLPELPNASFF
jgi:cytochrome c peroxidase